MSIAINEIKPSILKTISEMAKKQNTHKIKARSINDKLPKVKNAKKYNSLKDMAGIIKLDEKTNAVELKNSIYTNKARF